MFCMRAYPLHGQVGGRLGPGILDYFGPQMALAYRLDAISQGPKNSHNGYARIQNIMHGAV